MEFNLIDLLRYLGLHGPGALLVLFIFFVTWLFFSKGELSEKILGKVMEKIDNIKKTTKREKERQAQEASQKIDKILEVLRLSTGATNALVVRYKNGQYDTIGQSVLKFSATNEKTRPGFLQIGAKIQEVSRSLYGDICDTLIRDNHLYLKDVASMVKANPEFATFMGLFGNPERLYISALTTTDQDVVGFVCLVYTETTKDLEKNILEALSKSTGRIASIIEPQLDKKVDKK